MRFDVRNQFVRIVDIEGARAADGLRERARHACREMEIVFIAVTGSPGAHSVFVAIWTHRLPYFVLAPRVLLDEPGRELPEEMVKREVRQSPFRRRW